MPVLITNCTARKRGAAPALSMTSEMVGSSCASTVGNWRQALARHHPRRPAKEVYVGRSIVDALSAARSAEGRLFFVSAGLGIIAESELIPTYDLTPVAKKGGLSDALSQHKISASDWWVALSNNGLSQLIDQFREEQVLVALPATYLKMVAKDLEASADGVVSRLRIFTSKAGMDELPKRMRQCVMPYDDRLNSISGCAGTRSDFPQRAMRHFVQVLRATQQTLDDAHSAVEQSLAELRLRSIPTRKRLDDTAIKRLILLRWEDCHGRSAQLLRAIRDEEMVACEQGRFALLWREVRDVIHHSSFKDIAP